MSRWSEVRDAFEAFDEALTVHTAKQDAYLKAMAEHVQAANELDGKREALDEILATPERRNYSDDLRSAKQAVA